MKTGDVVHVDLIKPEIELALELVEYHPYEPSAYVWNEQWSAIEPILGDDPTEHLEPDRGLYWIDASGAVFHTLAPGLPNMEVGVCPMVRDHNNDDRW